MIKVSFFNLIVILILLLFLNNLDNTIYITKYVSNIPFDTKLYNTIEEMENNTEIKKKTEIKNTEIKKKTEIENTEIKQNTENINKNTNAIKDIKINNLILDSQNKIKELSNKIKQLTLNIDSNSKKINNNNSIIEKNKTDITSNNERLDKIYNYEMKL